MRKEKLFAYLLCMLFVMPFFVACEDDTTEDVYTIKIGEMSDAYAANITLQTCVGVTLADCMIDVAGGIKRTEKNAKEWFDATCNSVKNSGSKINMLVTIEPDTWVELQLLNSNNAVVKAKKVKFEVTSTEN